MRAEGFDTYVTWRTVEEMKLSFQEINHNNQPILSKNDSFSLLTTLTCVSQV